MLSQAQLSLKMNDEEFDDFRRCLLLPMIKRHHDMFPGFQRRVATATSGSAPSPPGRLRIAASGEKYPGTDRYAPCPCNSGEKYKFCCGVKGR